MKEPLGEHKNKLAMETLGCTDGPLEVSSLQYDVSPVGTAALLRQEHRTGGGLDFTKIGFCCGARERLEVS